MENINDQINALEERMYKSEHRIYNAQQELISNLEKIKQLKDKCGNFAKPAESFKPAYSFFMKAR